MYRNTSLYASRLMASQGIVIPRTALKNGQISLEASFQKGEDVAAVRRIKHAEELPPFKAGLLQGGLLLQDGILVHS